MTAGTPRRSTACVFQKSEPSSRDAFSSSVSRESTWGTSMVVGEVVVMRSDSVPRVIARP